MSYEHCGLVVMDDAEARIIDGAKSISFEAYNVDPDAIIETEGEVTIDNEYGFGWYKLTEALATAAKLELTLVVRKLAAYVPKNPRQTVPVVTACTCQYEPTPAMCPDHGVLPTTNGYEEHQAIVAAITAAAATERREG